MALNRYFQKGQSGYQSQYVPLKIPFQLMQQKVANEDAKVDLAKQQLYGLTDTKALGLEDLGITPSERDYYGGSEAAITQKFGKLAVEDYNNSAKAKKQLDDHLSYLLDDKFLEKYATGEIADGIIKGNQLYKNLNEVNVRNQARIDWRKKAEEERAKHSDDIMSSPWLDTQYELELNRMKEDPTYIPSSMPIWGKSLDRSSLLLSEVDRLKDNVKAGEKIQPGELYTKWSKWSGRTADEYETFALTILDNQNSKIRRDIDAQVDAHIQAGLHKEAGLSKDEFREKATLSEINNLLESARQLHHTAVDTKYTGKGQHIIDAENAPPPLPVPDLREFGPQVSYNDYQNSSKAIGNEITRLKGLIEKLPDGDDKKYQYQKELEKYEKQKETIDANLKLADIDIESTFGEQLKFVRSGQIDQLLFENPEKFEFFVKQNENGSYYIDERNFNQFIEASGIQNKDIPKYKQIIQEKIESGTYESNLNFSKGLKNNLNVYNNLETTLGATTAFNFKNSVNSGDKFYSLSQGTNKETLDNTLYQLGYSKQELDGLSKGQTINLFLKEMSKIDKYNNEKNINAKNANELYSQIEQTKEEKVRQNPFDYYDAFATVREIDKGEIGYVAASLDVSNSKIITADGTEITDPIVLERIANKLAEGGKNITGITTRDGKLVVKEGLSQYDIMSPQEIQKQLATLDLDPTSKEGQQYITTLQTTPANINRVELSSRYGTQLKQNTINEVNKSNAPGDVKSSMVANIDNESTITRMNSVTNKLINSISGEGQYTEHLDEKLYIKTYDDSGNQTGTLEVNVLDVQINNIVGSSPTYEYLVKYEGHEDGIRIFVSSPDSRYLQEKIIYNEYNK